jgi:hypothetical protein
MNRLFLSTASAVMPVLAGFIVLLAIKIRFLWKVGKMIQDSGRLSLLSTCTWSQLVSGSVSNGSLLGRFLL